MSANQHRSPLGPDFWDNLENSFGDVDTEGGEAKPFHAENLDNFANNTDDGEGTNRPRKVPAAARVRFQQSSTGGTFIGRSIATNGTAVSFPGFTVTNGGVASPHKAHEKRYSSENPDHHARHSKPADNGQHRFPSNSHSTGNGDSTQDGDMYPFSRSTTRGTGQYDTMRAWTGSNTTFTQRLPGQTNIFSGRFTQTGGTAAFGQTIRAVGQYINIGPDGVIQRQSNNTSQQPTEDLFPRRDSRGSTPGVVEDDETHEHEHNPPSPIVINQDFGDANFGSHEEQFQGMLNNQIIDTTKSDFGQTSSAFSGRRRNPAFPETGSVPWMLGTSPMNLSYPNKGNPYTASRSSETSASRSKVRKEPKHGAEKSDADDDSEWEDVSDSE